MKSHLSNGTTPQRAWTLVGVVLPLVAVVIAALLTWQQLTTWRDIALLAGMYVVCGLGITVGFHRMLTHRSFEAHPVVRFFFLVLGSMAIEGPAR